MNISDWRQRKYLPGVRWALKPAIPMAGSAVSAQQFLKQLSGLVQYALRVKNGMVDLSTLGGVTGGTKEMIARGIEWMIANGNVQIIDRDRSIWHLSPEGTLDEDEKMLVSESLTFLFQEAGAFRRFYANPDTNIHALLDDS